MENIIDAFYVKVMDKLLELVSLSDLEIALSKKKVVKFKKKKHRKKLPG